MRSPERSHAAIAGPPSASRTRSRGWPATWESGGSGIAGKLERALRDGDAASPGALSEFASLLGPQVEAIRRAFRSGGSGGSGAAPDTTAANPWDAAAGRAAIGRLRKLLASSDGGAADVFDEVSGALAGAVARPRLEALGEAIQEFDFAGALSKLDAIAGECGAAEDAA